jgi:hypothetical protein
MVYLAKYDKEILTESLIFFMVPFKSIKNTLIKKGKNLI